MTNISILFVPDDRSGYRVLAAAVVGETIKEAATTAGVDIPTFCLNDQMPPGMDRPGYTLGNCGQCNVTIQRPERPAVPVPSCRYRLTDADDGAVITVHSAKLDRQRDISASLIAERHNGDCGSCVYGAEDCDLRAMLASRNVGGLGLKGATPAGGLIDETHPALTIDHAKCVLCRRCETICPVDAIKFVGRGSDVQVVIDQERCINCGQCSHVCPAAAIIEKDATALVGESIADNNKIVTVQIAPAVRVAIGEAFGLPPGTDLTGKLYTALYMLGFDAVFDTNFSADLTIMEEGIELLKRVKAGGQLPMFTSCCPGWIKYVETYWPDLTGHLSTCKSPQQMLGALTKTYWAEDNDYAPAEIVSVSVMPCTAKKFEADRSEMADSGARDVDYVLTTRELIRMLKRAGIDLPKLQPSEPDPLLSEQTGAAPIFGATGGVLEAALRTVYFYATGSELANVSMHAVRGMAGVREAEINLAGTIIKVAVVHGLHNLPPILQQVRAGNSPYVFIEVMTCPGGCVGGGGQPRGFNMDVRRERALGLYAIDANMPFRRSHENQEVQWLRGNLSEDERHRLLHTTYKGKQQ